MSRSFCYLLHILYQVCDHHYFSKHFLKKFQYHILFHVLHSVFIEFNWSNLYILTVLLQSTFGKYPHLKIQSGHHQLFWLLTNERVHN